LAHLFEKRRRSFGFVLDILEVGRHAQILRCKWRRECKGHCNGKAETCHAGLLPHATGMMGRRRNAVPVMRRHPFAIAGAMGGVPGSPTPVGSAVEGRIATSMDGISEMRRMR